MGGGWNKKDIDFDDCGRMLILNAELFEALRGHYNRTGKVVISKGVPDPDGPAGGVLPPRPEPPPPDPGPRPDEMCVCELRLDKLNGWPLEMWEQDFHGVRSLGDRPNVAPPTAADPGDVV